MGGYSILDNISIGYSIWDRIYYGRLFIGSKNKSSGTTIFVISLFAYGILDPGKFSRHPPVIYLCMLFSTQNMIPPDNRFIGFTGI